MLENAYSDGLQDYQHNNAITAARGMATVRANGSGLTGTESEVSKTMEKCRVKCTIGVCVKLKSRTDGWLDLFNPYHASGPPRWCRVRRGTVPHQDDPVITPDGAESTHPGPGLTPSRWPVLDEEPYDIEITQC